MNQEFDGQLAPCPTSPNCVSSLASDDLHRVEPLILTAPIDSCWENITKAIKAIPRTLLIDKTPRYLHVEVRSFLFRFVDHLELAASADNHRVDIRSASVTGHSDMGVNRKRVEKIRKVLIEQGICTTRQK